VKVYKYNVTDRLGKATLCSKNENGTDYYLMGEPDVENLFILLHYLSYLLV